MDLLTRLRIFLGLAADDANVVADDIFPQFLADIQHEQGNAVQLVISSLLFTEENMGELLAADLIYYWFADEATGNFVLYSDKERLAKFDITVLAELERTGAASVPPVKWWEA